MPHDPLKSFSSEDAQIETAIRMAKDSFQQFLQAFCAPTESQNSFLVKVAFAHGDKLEHIWVADLDFSSREKVSGVLANEPKLRSLSFMQTVEFHPRQITDWMYIDDGHLVGGYTTRVIRECMTPEERQVYDATAPYKITKV